jgi:hypothetical protein
MSSDSDSDGNDGTRRRIAAAWMFLRANRHIQTHTDTHRCNRHKLSSTLSNCTHLCQLYISSVELAEHQTVDCSRGPLLL